MLVGNKKDGNILFTHSFYLTNKVSVIGTSFSSGGIENPILVFNYWCIPLQYNDYSTVELCPGLFAQLPFAHHSLSLFLTLQVCLCLQWSSYWFGTLDLSLTFTFRDKPCRLGVTSKVHTWILNKTSFIWGGGGFGVIHMRSTKNARTTPAALRTFEIIWVHCSILELRWVFRGVMHSEWVIVCGYAQTTTCGKKRLHVRKQEDPYQTSDSVRGGELWEQSTEDGLGFSFLWWSPRRAPLDRRRCLGVSCRRATITSTKPRPRSTNGSWTPSLSFKEKSRA